MDQFEKQFADKALSDLTRIYRDEEDPTGKETDTPSLINYIGNRFNLAYQPEFSNIEKRYNALEAASGLLVYAARLHSKIHAETGESLEEVEGVIEDEETEDYQLLIRLVIGGPQMLVLENVNKFTAKEFGEIYATTGSWIRFKECEKWIGPNDIEEIIVKRVEQHGEN